MSAQAPKLFKREGKAIPQPHKWPDDGGKKREPVYDHNFDPPRLVRICGWRHCMANPKHVFWSPDVSRVRICDYHKVQHGVKLVDHRDDRE